MKVILYTLFVISCFSVNAQNVIRGTVIDAETDEALSFANISVKGKETGTVSNSEGLFTLSLQGISPTDSLVFSYVGYKRRLLSVEEALKLKNIELVSNAVQLSEFSVSSRQYSVSEILDSVKSNCHNTWVQGLRHKKIFMRHEEITNINHFDMEYVRSSNEFVNEDVISSINEEMPDSVKSFSDLLLNAYWGDSGILITPIAGQELSENWDFSKELNDNLDGLANNVKENVDDEDSYYKIRSGVFAGKADFEDDTTVTMSDDSLNFVYKTKTINNRLTTATQGWKVMIWDFFNKYKRYNYTLKTVINDNKMVYIIEFTPKKSKALYKGRICVDAQSFALLRLDYAYDEGKEKSFGLLGVEYAQKEDKGCIIIEKADDSYYVKYASHEEEERVSIKRPLALKQKKKKFLTDKTLDEIKVKLNMDFSFSNKSEMLTVENNPVTAAEYFAIEQPDTIKVKRVNKYSADIWKNNSIIEPTKMLKEYEQQYE